MEITWKCDICGQIKPDNKISVLAKPWPIDGITAVENIKYCNDSLYCKIGATKFSHFPQKKEELPTSRFELMDLE